MQAAAVVEAGQQVLADAPHAQHGASGQVVLRQPRVPQLPAHQPVAGERGVQALPGEVDGVALGHVRVPVTPLSPWGPARRPRRARRRGRGRTPAGRPRPRLPALSGLVVHDGRRPRARMSATTAAAHAVDSPRPRWAGSVTTPMSSCAAPDEERAGDRDRPAAVGRHPGHPGRREPRVAAPGLRDPGDRRVQRPERRASVGRDEPADGQPDGRLGGVGQLRDDPVPDPDLGHVSAPAPSPAGPRPARAGPRRRRAHPGTRRSRPAARPAPSADPRPDRRGSGPRPSPRRADGSTGRVARARTARPPWPREPRAHRPLWHPATGGVVGRPPRG